jgi:dihydroorotase
LKHCKCLEATKNILVKDSKIAYFGNEHPSCEKVYDLKNHLFLPGMIDPHVHVRDLQQSDKEDWLSASKAAINGGVTTISDMPNTIPPTTDFAGLIEKQKAMKKSLVNSFCYLGATNENATEIENILAEKPDEVKGIKVFLSASSQNEIINETQLKKFFQIALKYDTILLFHNELQSVIDKYSYKYKHNILNHNNIRNSKAAISGMNLILKLQKKYPAKVYICHVSTAEELELIKTYKPDFPLFCEITPHHLLLNETILPKVGNFGKVNPPLRTEKDNEALWQAIDAGIVDCIGSDHAPHLRSEKEQEYDKAPSGFPGLETSLPVLLAAWKERKMDLQKLVQLTSENAAKIFNIEKRGKIAEDYLADLVIIDENEKTVIQAENFKSKAKYSPFEGWKIPFRIQKTIMNGKMYEINNDLSHHSSNM